MKTGKIYNSTGDASRETGLKSANIYNSVHGAVSSDQNYFEYLENYNDTIENLFIKRDKKRLEFINRSPGNSIKIRCLNDNKVFDSITGASRYYKVDRDIITKYTKLGKMIPTQKLTFEFV